MIENFASTNNVLTQVVYINTNPMINRETLRKAIHAFIDKMEFPRPDLCGREGEPG